MKHCWLFLIMILLCTACSDDDEDTTSTKPPTRVVITYMMAENSLSNYAVSDLNEIRQGVSLIPEGCHMVVFIDNSSTATPPEIISFDSVEGEQVLVEYPDDVVSTDKDAMLSILQYIINNNPADEYALILWSHGSGWMPANNSVSSRSIGIDNEENSLSNTGLEMDISTLKEVLTAVGVHWEYIFYDVCFMQCIEVAYELRHLTDWSIGSVAEIVATGAPYNILMPYFFEQTNFARDIAEQYYNTYKDNSGMLLSSVKSDALDALADATADALLPLNEYPTADLQKYCTYASSTGYKPEYYDMGSCIYHWAGSSGYNTWAKAMEAAVPYRYYSNSWTTSYSTVFTASMTDAEHYSGVSMYFPIAGRDRDNAFWRDYEWYEAVGYLFDR